MSPATIDHRPRGTERKPSQVSRLAAATSALIASIYGLIYAGVLSVGRAEAGDLGILGVAGGVFLVLALLLWRLRSRLLYAATALLQLLLAVMYVAVAPERDPAFEMWGLTIRALSLVLLVAVATLFVQARRDMGDTTT
jgi:hypothetical protein